ncbi:hypothetical protein [Microcystis phage Mae-JY30]
MAREIETIDPKTGEIETETVEKTSLAVALSRAEVDQQITTAHAYPRAGRKGGLKTIVNAIMDLATLSEAAAEECVYALPRGGKPIKGPSVRLAEIVAGQYGNCRIGARVVHVDKFEKYVEAEGVFHDLESNTATTARVRRRIVDKNGRLFNDDMILVTGNAAASIAKRNAILGGVPKAVWDPAYQAAHAVIAGDVKTLAVRRDEAIKAFAIWGVKPEQIFAALEIGGLDDIGLDEIATLRSMFKAVKEGEQKVEDFFPAVADQTKAADAAKGTAAKLGKIAEEGKADAKPKADEKPRQPAEAKGEAAGKADSPADGKKAQEAQAAGKDEPQEERPAHTEAQGDEAPADQAGDGNGEEDTPPAFDAAQIDAAYDRGAEAKRKGMSRKATPPEWREPGNEPLLNAWLDGFDRTERE